MQQCTFTFTFMHLADAFIQSDLHCIQVTVLHFITKVKGHKGYKGSSSNRAMTLSTVMPLWRGRTHTHLS